MVQKFLARAGGMVDIAKFSSNIVYHHAKFGRSTFSHTVRVHVKRPKKFLARWYPIDPLIRIWRVAELHKHSRSSLVLPCRIWSLSNRMRVSN